MLLHITRATHIEDHKIAVVFNDGREGIADLSGILAGPVFAPLWEVPEFARFRVDKELDAIVWSNGADLAPERIYFEAFKHDEDSVLQARFREWGYLE
uniref:DUF2442 domain-containing protein n=1 Tax=Candidatus Kentrum sp. TC TaxID=2126339 RepID=A0A450ZU25_9GAMM|nr:MAG: Protein of unknown function (DUF2442) [Candidatus Kentron sp. TC]